MLKNNVSTKIKNDYGTLVLFCKKHNLNLQTFKQVLYGYGKSQRVVEILLKHKYIKSADELTRA
ncbi:hypothetical protein [Campylobacter rectus]|uniref:hypothetical protein n=1 Tax=Campylobacter rectus TaxID=203 RepID=UPI000F5DC5DD|nr:hypothetical protein [Campylobacter rectus]RRD53588.1 hypothetical protein EII16_08585 [Campylobacter rectus]